MFQRNIITTAFACTILGILQLDIVAAQAPVATAGTRSSNPTAIRTSVPVATVTAVPTIGTTPVATIVACNCPLPPYSQFGEVRNNCVAKYETCKFSDNQSAEYGGGVALYKWGNLCAGNLSQLKRDYARLAGVNFGDAEVHVERFICRLESETKNCNVQDTDPCTGSPIPPPSNFCANTKFPEQSFKACNHNLEGNEWKPILDEITSISNELGQMVDSVKAQLVKRYPDYYHTPTVEELEKPYVRPSRTPYLFDDYGPLLSEIWEFEDRLWNQLIRNDTVLRKCKRIKTLREVADRLCKRQGQGGEDTMCTTGDESISLSPYSLTVDNCVGRFGSPGECSANGCRIEYYCPNKPAATSIFRSCQAGPLPGQF